MGCAGPGAVVERDGGGSVSGSTGGGVNYYQRHLGDYAKDTGWLSTYQHGVFALLLDWYYANEKAIPLPIAYRIVKARSGPERRATDEVLLAFFDLNKDPGFAHNKHADEVIAKYKVKSEVNSLIAKERESTKRARIVPDSCNERGDSGEPSHKPVAKNQKEQKQDQEKPTRKRADLTELKTFLADCKAKGEKPIPDDDPVFAYAEKVGLPRDFLALAWAWFKRSMEGKRQRNWRQHFRNAVEGNWPKYWYAADGGWALTTAGQQAARAHA